MLKIPIIIMMYTSTMAQVQSTKVIKVIPSLEVECPICKQIELNDEVIDDFYISVDGKISRGDRFYPKPSKRLPPIKVKLYFNKEYESIIRELNSRIYVCEHGVEYKFYLLK